MNTERTEKFVNAIACDLEEGGFRQVSGTMLRRTLATAVSAALPLLADTGIPASQPAELAEQQVVHDALAATLGDLSVRGMIDDVPARMIGEAARKDMAAALAATGKQQGGEAPGVDVALEPVVEKINSLIHAAHYHHRKHVEKALYQLLPVIQGALVGAGPQQVGEVQGDAQARFEDWYVQNAFDYEANPIGSRDCGLMRKAWHAALAARQPGAQVPHGSEFAVSRTMEDAEAASDGMLPAALVPVADEWYRLCERRFSVDRIRISGKLAEAIVEAVCAAPPAQGIDLGKFMDFIGFAIMQALSLPEADPRRDYIRKGDELLALIGQRDAAPGVE